MFTPVAEQPRRRARRSGFTLMEILSSIALLTAIMFSLVPLVTGIARQRLLAEQRTTVELHVANVLEQYVVRGYQGLQPGEEPGPVVPQEVIERVGSIVQRVIVVDLAEPVPSRCVKVVAEWRTPRSDDIAQVQRTAFVYAEE